MEYSEYIEWLAYMRIEPLGERRADLQFAMLMAVIVNLWSDKKKKPGDFMPDYWGDHAVGMEEKFRQLAAALGQHGTDTGDTSGQAGSGRG
jgi:hypothetical protein